MNQAVLGFTVNLYSSPQNGETDVQVRNRESIY